MAATRPDPGVAVDPQPLDAMLLDRAKLITERELERYAERTAGSQRATARARKVLPLGVPSSFQAYDPHPIVVRHAGGSAMVDVDGHHYVDTTDDNGGVHINSGIPNKAFHVLATTLGGNAWEVAGQVWVDTITGDIRADCDFATFARLTVAAATARHGADSEVVTAVRAGWDAVGVTTGATAPSGPGTSTPSESESESESDAGSGSGSGGTSGPATQVSVRRTGGFAGRTVERTVALAELPNGDARAWHSLLADDGLPALADEVAGRPRMPDTYCYGVRCETPPLDLELPELELTDDVRSLLERTLGTVDG